MAGGGVATGNTGDGRAQNNDTVTSPSGGFKPEMPMYRQPSEAPVMGQPYMGVNVQDPYAHRIGQYMNHGSPAQRQDLSSIIGRPMPLPHTPIAPDVQPYGQIPTPASYANPTPPPMQELDTTGMNDDVAELALARQKADYERNVRNAEFAQQQGQENAQQAYQQQMQFCAQNPMARGCEGTSASIGPKQHAVSLGSAISAAPLGGIASILGPK